MAKKKKVEIDDYGGEVKSLLQQIKSKSQRFKMSDAMGNMYEIHLLSVKALEIINEEKK